MLTLGVVLKAVRILVIALDVADKVITIARKAGLIRNTQDVSELGAKALKGKEMGIEEPEDLSKYNEYLKKIDELPITPEEMAKYGELEKKETGAKILVKSVDSVFPDIQNLVKFLEDVKDNPDFYTTTRMEKYLKLGSEQKVDMEDIVKYLDGGLDEDVAGMAKQRRLQELLEKAESELEPEEGRVSLEDEVERREAKS